jgi:TM2 domain-containing membrane protein YozV
MQKSLTIGILVLLCTLLRCDMAAAVYPAAGDTLYAGDSLQDSVRVVVIEDAPAAPEETFGKKKLVTAILAFPMPFGFVGLHRIYLGCEPWIPVAYLLTGGGGLGLLPLMDFIYIVTADEKEFRKYENNSKLFMFVE